jgi:hypothetical protein
MKDGPEKALDTMIVIQIVSDPVFYRECPEYLFMQQAAQQAYAQYLALMNPTNKTGCKSCSNKKTMQPVIQLFLQHTKNLWDQTKEQGVKNLVDYISKRMNYRPRPVILYYRERGTGIRRIDL